MITVVVKPLPKLSRRRGQSREHAMGARGEKRQVRRRVCVWCVYETSTVQYFSHYSQPSTLSYSPFTTTTSFKLHTYANTHVDVSDAPTTLLDFLSNNNDSLSAGFQGPAALC